MRTVDCKTSNVRTRTGKHTQQCCRFSSGPKLSTFRIRKHNEAILQPKLRTYSEIT